MSVTYFPPKPYSGSGSGTTFPCIAAYYYPAQYASADNTATTVLWNATSALKNFTLNVDNTATALVSGIYKITYSLQFANSDNAQHDAIVWLRVNGTDVADSITVVISGPGLLSTAVSTTKVKSLALKYNETATIWSDGTAGTGTLTSYVGTSAVSTAKLTQAALETLAVIAYKQPVSRARVSAIRGVNVEAVMKTLVTRGLVEESGVENETGAILYRTTSDRKSTRLNSSHVSESRMPSSA